MRLNYVESFYAFLLCFYSKHSDERGQSTVAGPFVGVAGHGLATCKRVAGCCQSPMQMGGRLRPRPPTQGATDCGQGPMHRGRPATASTVPVGAAGCRATPARGSLQWPARKGWPQQPGLPLVGAAASGAGAIVGEQGQPPPV
ncbi:hypothetical protein BHM03_00037750 [Ensete ventricosum]|nr:hypothetical protein BHM03_00037750 [Ensete ventricosum]